MSKIGDVIQIYNSTDLLELSKRQSGAKSYTGCPQLDAHGPTEVGRPIVVAGRTGDGKSTICLHYAINTATLGIPTGIIYLEDPAPVVAKRFALQRPKANIPLFITSAVGVRLGGVIEILDALIDKGCRVIWIDYLQRLYGNSVVSDRRQDINLCLETVDCHAAASGVLLGILSQVRRPDLSKSGNVGKCPQLWELSESSAIEQRAQSVVGVWLEEEQILTRVIKNSNARENTSRRYACHGGKWVEA